MEIGTILKYYRKMHGLTQIEVAEIAGINEKYYGRLERDESVPTLDKVEQLCRAFDIRIVDMLATKPNFDAKPLLEEQVKIIGEKVVYYCNCCGTTFEDSDPQIVFCPNCQCEFDEANSYIERTLL